MHEQLTQPQLKIVLPRLQSGELFGLMAFAKCKIKSGSFDVPARWLLSLCEDELRRRDSEANEPGSFSLPNWNLTDMSEALLFFYVLSRHGLTLGAAEFCDEVFKHVVSSAVSVLAFYGESQKNYD